MRAEILGEYKRCDTEYRLPDGFDLKNLNDLIITDPVGNMMTLSAAKVRRGWKVDEHTLLLVPTTGVNTLHVGWVYSA